MAFYGEENVGIAPQNLRRPTATMPAGTVVLTLRGALPVENLHRGDRLVTRAGATVLKRVHSPYPNFFALEFGDHEGLDQESVYVLDESVCNAYKRSAD